MTQLCLFVVLDLIRTLLLGPLAQDLNEEVQALLWAQPRC